MPNWMMMMMMMTMMIFPPLIRLSLVTTTYLSPECYPCISTFLQFVMKCVSSVSYYRFCSSGLTIFLCNNLFLKMEAARSSETLVSNHISALCHKPDLNIHRRENLGSCVHCFCLCYWYFHFKLFTKVLYENNNVNEKKLIMS